MNVAMDEAEISYKTLRKIQQAEKNSPQITQINKEFYRDVTIFLQNLQKRLEEENKPQKQMLLAEECQNIEKIIRNIYEHREKKIMLAAIAKARGGNPIIKTLLPEEKMFFDELYQKIVLFRKKIFSSEGEKDENEDKETDQNIPSEKESLESNEGKMDSSKNKPTAYSENSHPILRIREDIPSFVGTDDNTYTLYAGDIVSLPKNMAEMLLNKKVAKKVNER